MMVAYTIAKALGIPRSALRIKFQPATLIAVQIAWMSIDDFIWPQSESGGRLPKRDRQTAWVFVTLPRPEAFTLYAICKKHGIAYEKMLDIIQRMGVEALVEPHPAWTKTGKGRLLEFLRRVTDEGLVKKGVSYVAE